MALRATSQSGRGALGGLPTPFMICSGHERALMPLLVLLLVGTVRGTFAGVLVVGGDVKELLGGSWALTS